MEISTWTRWKGKENFNLNEQKKRISTLNEQKGEVQLSGSENFSSSDWNGKFKENRIEAYLYIKDRENEIFYSQWKRKIHNEKNVLKSEFTRLRDVFLCVIDKCD